MSCSELRAAASRAVQRWFRRRAVFQCSPSTIWGPKCTLRMPLSPRSLPLRFRLVMSPRAMSGTRASALRSVKLRQIKPSFNPSFTLSRLAAAAHGAGGHELPPSAGLHACGREVVHQRVSRSGTAIHPVIPPILCTRTEAHVMSVHCPMVPADMWCAMASNHRLLQLHGIFELCTTSRSCYLHTYL